MHTLSSLKKRSDSGVRVNKLDVSGFDLTGVFWFDLFYWFHSPSAFGLCHQISATAALDINTFSTLIMTNLHQVNQLHEN